MIDRDGNSLPRAMDEHVNVWFRDGTKCHEMKISRKNFWFRNGQLCKDFCQENDARAEFWKKPDKTQTCRSKEPWNKVQEFNEVEQENVKGRGDVNLDDKLHHKFHDDSNSEVSHNPVDLL